MLSLATLVQQVKRKTRYGDIANTSDQVTADIVHYINQRCLRLWRRYPWHWSIVDFTVSLVSGTTEYTLASTVGDIIAIETGTVDVYYKECTRKTLKDRNDEDRYVVKGLNSSKAIKIEVYPVPTAAADRDGWGKARLNRYTTADLATNTDIAYFPEDVLTIIEIGVLADIYEAQGKPNESLAKEGLFMKEMESLVKESTIMEDSEEQIPAPDYYTFHKRKRGGTTVT